MKQINRKTVEYRYYEMPPEIPLLALLGDGWVRPYGELGPDALHFHNHLEIGYCYEGHGALVVEQLHTPYGPGTYSVIPHNVCHTTVSDGGMLCRCEYLFVDIETFLYDTFSDNRRFAERLVRLVNQRPIIGEAAENPQISRLILLLIEEMRQKKPYYLVGARGLLMSLLISLARCAQDAETESLPQPENGPSLVILNALNYVSEHYSEEIKIAELAECCHMSETHFRRVFREIMSVTPLEYLNILRVEMACGLLRTSDYSMETIARRVGYPTMTTFDRNFRRVTGCSPLQWKKSPENYEQKLRNYRIAAFQGWR